MTGAGHDRGLPGARPGSPSCTAGARRPPVWRRWCPRARGARHRLRRDGPQRGLPLGPAQRPARRDVRHPRASPPGGVPSWRRARERSDESLRERGGSKVLLIGGGEAGRELISSMWRDPEQRWQPVGILDDDPLKRHRRIRGVPVLGRVSDLARVAESTRRRQRGDRHPQRRRGDDQQDPHHGSARRGRGQGAAVDHPAPHRPRRHPRHPRRQPHRRAGPQPARHRRRRDRRLPDRPPGTRDRRGRLDRLRAVPPDLPVRARRADDARPRRVSPARRPAVDPRARAARHRTTSSSATSATGPLCTRSSRSGAPRWCSTRPR